MKRKAPYSLIALLLVAMLAGCYSPTDLKDGLQLVADEPPRWVVPAVHGTANLRDILIGQDAQRSQVIQADPNGLLRLHQRFASIYRAQLLELVQPRGGQQGQVISWPLSEAGRPVSPEVIAQERGLAPSTIEVEVALPEEVQTINQLAYSLDLALEAEDLPMYLRYKIEFVGAKDQLGNPIQITLDTQRDGLEASYKLPYILLGKQPSGRLRLKWRISLEIIGIKQEGQVLPQTASLKLSLRELKVELFEGRLSKKAEIRLPKPIAFDFEEWGILEDLALQGSSLSLELGHRGRMGLSATADISLTNKKGKTLRLRPTLPLVSLNSIDQEASKTFSFDAEQLDDMLRGLSKTGLSLNSITLDYSRSAIYLDRNSFIDLSLVLDVPLRMKFDRLPIKLNLPIPKLNAGAEVDNQGQGLLESCFINLDVRSKLPIGFKISSLMLLNAKREPLSDGLIPLDFDLKPSADGVQPQDSQLSIRVTTRQLRLLPDARYIRFEGYAQSSGEWVELRASQDIQFKVVVSLNKKP